MFEEVRYLAVDLEWVVIIEQVHFEQPHTRSLYYIGIHPHTLGLSQVRPDQARHATSVFGATH